MILSNMSHIDLSKIGFEITIPNQESPKNRNIAKENNGCPTRGDKRTHNDGDALLASLKQQQHLEDWMGCQGKLFESNSSFPPVVMEEACKKHDLMEEPIEEDSEKMKVRSNSFLTYDSCLLEEVDESKDDCDDDNNTSASRQILVAADLGYEDVLMSHLDQDDSSSVHTRLSMGKPILNKRSSALRRASQCSGISKSSRHSVASRRLSQSSSASAQQRRSIRSVAQRTTSGSSTSSYLRDGDDRVARPRRLSVASHSSLRRRPSDSIGHGRLSATGNISPRSSYLTARTMEEDIAIACKELQDLACDE